MRDLKYWVSNSAPMSIYSDCHQKYRNVADLSPLLFARPLLLVHDHLLQKVLGKARTLLECLVETILATVVGVANHFGLLGAAVLAKEHHLGLGILVLALETFEIRQVGEVHGEDVVEPIKVASRNLNTNDLLACAST